MLRTWRLLGRAGYILFSIYYNRNIMILYFDKVDLFFNVLHIMIILINSLGWIFNITLKPSLYLILITLSCWTLLGIFQGIGFCPLTYIHSHYLYANYEFHLPFSYLDYLLIDNFNLALTSKTISIISIFVIFISLLINLKKNNLNNGFSMCLASVSYTHLTLPTSDLV